MQINSGMALLFLLALIPLDAQAGTMNCIAEETGAMVGWSRPEAPHWIVVSFQCKQKVEVFDKDGGYYLVRLIEDNGLSTMNPRPNWTVWAEGAYVQLSKEEEQRIKLSATVKQEFIKSNPCPANGKPSSKCKGYTLEYRKPLASGGTYELSNLIWQTVGIPPKIKAHMGKNITVCGNIAGTVYASGPTFLNIQNSTPPGFSMVLIQSKDRHNFRKPEIEYKDKRICATGKVSWYYGEAIIEAKLPCQIKTDVILEERK
jgi:hypothetical protein